MNEEAVRLWIRRAENDLKTAKDELGTDDPATDTVCFHLQQCCEKYLKAFLVFHGQEVPRTHNLAFVVIRCRGIDPEFESLEQLGIHNLTRYAVMTRYDEPFFPTKEECLIALELAEKVRTFVRTKLTRLGLNLP